MNHTKLDGTKENINFDLNKSYLLYFKELIESLKNQNVYLIKSNF